MYDLLNDALSQNREKTSVGIFSFFFFLNTPIEKSGSIHANFQTAEAVGGTSLIAAVIHYSDMQQCSPFLLMCV